MAQVHVEIASFNAGELSPLLGARFAVEKVATGCRRLRNFLIHVHGPAFRRPGMEYLGAAGGNGAKSRLLPFEFSTTTGAVLELHPGGLRVWSNGELVTLRTEVALPYTEQECAEVQAIQINDVLYLAHANHPPQKLVRWGDDDWRLSEVPWKWPAMGDENIRVDEIAAPSSSELLSVETQDWPEFLVPKESDIAFAIFNPDLTSASKVAKVQRFVSGAWETEHSFSWTTVAPTLWTDHWNLAHPARLTYSGPVTATAYSDLSWSTTFGTGDGELQLPHDVPQPPSARTVDVPAGDWQATAHCAASVPVGATLTIEKLVGGHWVLLHNFGLQPGKVNVWRGPKLTEALTVRFVWGGLRAMTGGTATVDHLVFPVSDEVTLAINNVSGSNRTLTASAPLFQPGHVGSFWQITHHREKPWVVITASEITGGGSPVLIMSAHTSDPLVIQGKWQLTTYGTWGANLFLEKFVNGTWVTLRSWSSAEDRNIIADGEEEHAVLMRLRTPGGVGAAATGADHPRFVLEALEAETHGLVKVTAIGALVGSTGKSLTATVDVISSPFSTDATSTWTEGAWSNVQGFPRCVALHGGRIWYGGTHSAPMRLWGSVVNDFEDFRQTSFDDAGVSFTPASQNANSMQWMLSHEKELYIGTGGDEWTLGTDQGPVTPTNVLMQRRSSYGSQAATALLINEDVVFVQRGGRKLRQIAPRSDAVAWSASDLTVLAEHVTQKGITQIAAMTNPFSILWGVTSDGKLLGMTFETEQNVFGWHIHETDGLIESVAVIRGAVVDEVWLQVNRAGVRTIERFDSLVMERRFDLRAELIYLDAAKRVVASEAFSEVTGLEYLEGRTVSVVADGAELAPRRVIGGKITLEAPALAVVVGLPYTSELQPMRLDVPLRDGTSQGRKFKTSRVALLLHESLGGEVASSPANRYEKLNYRRTSDPMDSAPPLFSGQLEMPIQGNAGDGVDVIIRQTSPLPFNVGAMVVKLDVYGE
jgi:hypothetical protein